MLYSMLNFAVMSSANVMQLNLVRKMKESHDQCSVHQNVLIDKRLGELNFMTH